MGGRRNFLPPEKTFFGILYKSTMPRESGWVLEHSPIPIPSLTRAPSLSPLQFWIETTS